MAPKLEDISRQQISDFLPDALCIALTSYQDFSIRAARQCARDFRDHHSACKAAIAHIELLLKLANWADLPDAGLPDQNRQIVLAALLHEARDELAGMQLQILENQNV